jgi:hypothetical protein
MVVVGRKQTMYLFSNWSQNIHQNTAFAFNSVPIQSFPAKLKNITPNYRIVTRSPNLQQPIVITSTTGTYTYIPHRITVDTNKL